MSLSKLNRRYLLSANLIKTPHSPLGSQFKHGISGLGFYHARSVSGYGRPSVSDVWCLLRRFRFSTWSPNKSYEFRNGSVYSRKPSSILSTHRDYASHASSTEQKSRKMLLYLTALVLAMVGSSYAAVPLYRRFCQATGYGGTIQRRETVEEKIARHANDGTVTTREIAVQFNADVADGMPWKFTPTQREVRVKPGESALAFYTAENRSSAPITGVSTYNVTPMKAAVYFNKIQCFCFEEQRLLPGEQIDMPEIMDLGDHGRKTWCQSILVAQEFNERYTHTTLFLVGKATCLKQFPQTRKPR